jgi:hypothetical protein
MVFLPFLLPALLAAGSPYSAVVVDATTNRPLENVSVRAGSAGGVTTNAQGVFSLDAGSGQALALTHLGYAPLSFTVPATSPRTDTLRLLPQTYVLDAVAVRPPRAQVFSSAPEKGPEIGRSVLPGQSVALLITRPAGVPADQPCVVNQVKLYLSDKVKEGRLRIRLVNLLHEENQGDRPGTNDLLPTPVVYSTEQLRNAPHGNLLVDLSAYNLLVPAPGLCVVVDGLPTDPATDVVSAKADPKGNVTVIVVPHAGGPTQSFPSDGFPHLVAKREAGTRTWGRSAGRPAWAVAPGMAYTVRADVSVFSY